MSARWLTLVRHAKSSWRFAGMDDFHRPLNKRGLRDAVRMPRHVASRVPAPGLVLCSDAVRAVQTCQALADAYGLVDDVVVLDHELYLAGATRLRETLARHGGEETHVMLVGHNPGLTDLYNQLVTTPLDNLPTFAVAHLELDAPSWEAVRPGCGRGAKVLLPKELLHDE
jgi:phosphohistidine phosphatase